MLPPVNYSPPPAAFPQNRELRCGESPCCLCGSGIRSHEHGARGHEFAPWSQCALVEAVMVADEMDAQAPCDEVTTLRREVERLRAIVDRVESALLEEE